MVSIVSGATVVFIPTPGGSPGGPGPPGSGSTIGVEDESNLLSTAIERLNFKGAGVQVALNGVEADIDIPGGGAGGGAGINPEDFGIVPSANATDTSHAAANSAAWAVLMATIASDAFIAATNYHGLPAVSFPGNYYHFNAALDLTDGVIDLSGTLPTGLPTAVGTTLVFPAGVTGIRVQSGDTSGATGGAVAASAFGAGSRIRNLAVKGAYPTAGAEAEAHGVQLRGNAVCENVLALDFQGDGFHIFADTGQSGAGPNYGNANMFQLRGCTAERCRDGVAIGGADANAYVIEGGSMDNNRRWGINDGIDDTSLGGLINGVHFDSNGISGVGTITVVTHGGNRYGVIVGQEAGASTNAPSGTTADNTWWYYISAGGAVGAAIPAWSSGTTYRAGGSLKARSANAAAVAVGCYHEPGQGLPQLAGGNWIIGGVMAHMRVVGSGGTLKHAGGMLEASNTIHTFGAIKADGEQHWAGPNSGAVGTIPEYDFRNTNGAFYRLRSTTWSAGALVRTNGEITGWDQNGWIYSALLAHHFKIGGGAYNTGSLGLTVDANGLTIPQTAAGSVAMPAAGFQTLFIDTADNKLKRKDSSGTVTILA